MAYENQVQSEVKLYLVEAGMWPSMNDSYDSICFPAL